MDNPAAEFDAHDLQLIENARRESEASDAAALAAAEQAAEPPQAAPETAAAPAAAPAAEGAPVQESVPSQPGSDATPPAAPAPAAPAAAPAATPAPAPAPAEAQGSVKAALRASRQSERRLREENERLQRELATRNAGAPSPAAAAAALTEEQLADLREFAPDAAAQLEALRAENERLRQVAEAAAPAPASPPFVPDQLVPEVQEAVDDIPELLQWQNDPDQRRWTAAKAADTMLRQSEGWANATFAQRFAKVTELVQQQFTTPSKAAPAPAPLEQALQRVAAAPPAATSAPLTVGDMRGGSSPSHNPTPDYHRMKEQGATDEDILAALPIMS